ncbi:MAG TPA: hypothetical protein VN181_15705 [Thermoanaerobaculia bacterium]|nr:hypothetical protein [Thermoanaerobaculia bacterium]
MLNLSGGVSVTLSTKLINVVDARGAKLAPATLQQVVAGVHVMVKLRTDATGNVKSAKIKLIP